MSMPPRGERAPDEDDVSSDDAIVSGSTERRRSLHEMNTGMMVFELQGTVGELKHALASLDARLARQDDRAAAIERQMADMKDQVGAQTPKLDRVLAFIEFAAPSFATKADTAELRFEIGRRPTRRQAILDIAWIVGLITAAITFGAHSLR